MKIPMSNKIKKIKEKLNKTIWTDNIAKLSSHLYEQRGNLQGKSSLLMLPKNTADVVKIVKICNKNKVSIVPQGGRTGLWEELFQIKMAKRFFFPQKKWIK